MGTETIDQDRLLEIYKVHAELAERVAALRESTNRVYASTAGGVLAASVLLYRSSVASPDDPLPMAMALLPLAGVMVSVSWGGSVLSITSPAGSWRGSAGPTTMSQRGGEPSSRAAGRWTRTR